MNLIETVPPATYPVDLAEVRAQLNIDTEDYDASLAACIAVATQMVEIHTGRALITRSYSAYLNWWPSGPAGHVRSYINLEKPPLISVTDLISYDDNDVATIYPASQYYVDTVRTPGRIVLRRGQVWPIPLRLANGIQIDFTAGYGANPGQVPEIIRAAILILVGMLREQRGDEVAPIAMPGVVVALLSPFLTWPPS